MTTVDFERWAQQLDAAIDPPGFPPAGPDDDHGGGWWHGRFPWLLVVPVMVLAAALGWCIGWWMI